MGLATVLVALSLALGSPARTLCAQTAADTTFYGVSYVEVSAAAKASAVAAVKRYRDASRTQTGYVRVELFEQVGRPGHFAIVEAWRDQNAFDAREAAAQARLLEELGHVRVSGYDQRPYKPLAVGAVPPSASARTISVVTHVDVAPNPRVAVLLTELAEASRRDPGNLRFDVYQHTMRANHFTVIETWQSEQALEQHAAADHTRRYRDELQPLTGSPLDERVYRAIE